MARLAFTERVFQQRDIEDSGIVTSREVKTWSGRVSKPVIGSRLYIAWLKKTGTSLLKAPNILLYYFVSIKSLLSTTLLLFIGLKNISDLLFRGSGIRVL